ncbi:MAG TPA: hypothetical protein VK975_00885 [Acidimicrobiales bacterium]|nr:hypothetical protein [Acidimicrobiales bacterium]
MLSPVEAVVTGLDGTEVVGEVGREVSDLPQPRTIVSEHAASALPVPL